MSKPVVVLAAENAGMKKLAGFLMAAHILVACNTAIVALYIASRTLHGITRDMDFNTRFRIKR